MPIAFLYIFAIHVHGGDNMNFYVLFLHSFTRSIQLHCMWPVSMVIMM